MQIEQPEGNYYDKYHSSNPIVKWMMRNFFADLEALLPAATEGLKILEAGCGEGEVTGFLAEKYGEYGKIDAFDISEKVISEAKRNHPQINFTTGDVYNIVGGKYDLVLASEVLEHLEHPEQALQELTRVTNKYLIVSVPREPVWRILNMIRGKYWKHLGNTPGHIQHWSSRAFCEFLMKSGMTIECVKKPFPWTMVLLKKE